MTFRYIYKKSTVQKIFQIQKCFSILRDIRNGFSLYLNGSRIWLHYFTKAQYHTQSTCGSQKNPVFFHHSSPILSIMKAKNQY